MFKRGAFHFSPITYNGEVTKLTRGLTPPPPRRLTGRLLTGAAFALEVLFPGLGAAEYAARLRSVGHRVGGRSHCARLQVQLGPPRRVICREEGRGLVTPAKDAQGDQSDRLSR